jgi:glucose-6-phosphate 1-dehydrogenase
MNSSRNQPAATVVFIFGGSGDLNFRKLTPALFNLRLDGYLPERFAVVGLGRSTYTNASFRERLAEGIAQFSRRKEKDGDWKTFAETISYLQIDAENAADYKKMTDFVQACEKTWGERPNVLIYLAVAPQLVPGIAEKLGKLPWCGDRSHVRIVVEKPFGHDLKSARELNALLLGLFAEEQIYRIDHYLGKETVQNILALRFANAFFEPIWSRQYIDYVQITAAETVGLEGRGGYYEGAGALRDMVQNHILQLLCLVAMEAPVSFEANEIRNKKVDVLNAIRRIAPEEVRDFAVRGQYGDGWMKGKKLTGYREEEGVDAQSGTETFAALKFYVNNWRWEGVPFYVRTGKVLHEKTTNITVQFKPAPNYAFPEEAAETWRPNRLTIRIQPEADIRMRLQAKRPGQTMVLNPVDMVFNYRDAFDGQDPEAYETLLFDAMTGDATLFMRADQVEAAWRVITPVLESWAMRPPVDFPNYAPDSWGPEDAEALIAQDGFHWVTLPAGR